MEKERKVKYLSLIAVIVAILGLTVAFAAMSATLKINGTATLDAASWDVHFENLEYGASGEGASVGKPVMSGTSITGINAVITKPNDYVSYTMEIVNAGTIDAKIASVEISKLCTLQSSVEACDWDNDGKITQTDIDKVNNNISFIATFVDESGYPVTPTVGDTLAKKERKQFGIMVAYWKGMAEAEATELPKRDLKFNNLSVKINYVQAN